jgi:hypothetical protein
MQTNIAFIVGALGGGMVMTPSTTKSEHVEGGARVVFTPRDPAEPTQLREHLRRHAEQTTSGQWAQCLTI